MIEITINDKNLEIPEGFNILQLLKEVDSPQEGIAVAINNSIVSRDLWSSKTFSANDSILIIRATQGG